MSQCLNLTPHVLGLIEEGLQGRHLMDRALEHLVEQHPHAVWDELRGLDFDGDVEGSKAWIEAVVTSEPPGRDITGFWFGIFNPIVEDGRAAKDFYISGSSMYPRDDWPCDTSWWAIARYRHSPVMRELYRRTAAVEDDRNVGRLGDDFLALAFTGATLNTLLATHPVTLPCGESERGVAFGHDSGDFYQVAVVDADGVHRTPLKTVNTPPW